MFAGTNGRGSPISTLAVVTPTPDVVFASAAVATVIGAGRRVFKTFKRMKHGGETIDPVLVLYVIEENPHAIRKIQTETAVVDQSVEAKKNGSMMHHDVQGGQRTRRSEIEEESGCDPLSR